MEKLNKLNWQYYLTYNGKKQKLPLQDIESILIHYYLQKIKKDKKKGKLLWFPSTQMRINLYSCVAYFSNVNRSLIVKR